MQSKIKYFMFNTLFAKSEIIEYNYCMHLFRTKGLSFKFSFMFAGITLVTLFLTFILAYWNQNKIYSIQREESIQYIADYLEKLVKLDDEDFLIFQDYFIQNYEQYKIPVDFDQEEINKSRELYETLFAQQYPSRVLGTDIRFEELSKEVKDAYAIWNYEYYRFTFEQAAKSFNIAYAYYLVPTGEPEHMFWFLDIARDPSDIYGEDWLALCLDIHDSVVLHPHMWEAWNTGKRPSGYDIYDDSYTYGSTYAYYTPLIINDIKLGVIGVEVDIAKYNHDIMTATLEQMFTIGGVLILMMILLLIAIRVRYIRKLVMVRDTIASYSISKDPQIAKQLTEEVNNKDEISAIIAKFSDMIYELDLYMNNLSEAKKSLHDSQQIAMEMQLLAMKDMLTGIRNKTAFDKEIEKIESEINMGKIHVGIAMIDLNFLKKINDTYGHEQGNQALISLCKLICNHFRHSPVFRIGGDEFTVILKDQDLYNIRKLVLSFKEIIQELDFTPDLEEWERISAAIGYAVFDPFVDETFESTFKRAINEMRKDKKDIKAIRED